SFLIIPPPPNSTLFPYTTLFRSAKSYNLRGDLVDLPTFHRALCQVEPAAERLITYGTRQIRIAYDLDDAALERDLGPLVKTPLVDRKSTRLNSSHSQISYAVFCL